jgi:hypothetical protein
VSESVRLSPNSRTRDGPGGRDEPGHTKQKSVVDRNPVPQPDSPELIQHNTDTDRHYSRSRRRKIGGHRVLTEERAREMGLVWIG